MLAASRPDQITGVTTSIDSSTGGVVIDWSLPNSRGSDILSYIVEVQSQLGSWIEPGNGCDSSSTEMLEARSCIVEMSQLISSTYDLVFDDLVEVRVSAVNGIGQSSVSDVNADGARVKVVPGKAFTPSEGAATSQSQIQVEW